MQVYGISEWRKDHDDGSYMYRVDKYDDVPTVGGFPFPASDTHYFTGLGGLHFWVELEDAVAYATENSMNHSFACERVQEEVVLLWSRELMAAQQVHVVPTLVQQVWGYSAPREMRDELVVPGVPPAVYRPLLLRINL